MLAIDVGNTNITHAIFEGQTLVHTWRMRTEDCTGADAYWHACETDIKSIPGEVAVASVRDDITAIINKAFLKNRGITPVVITRHTDMGIKILYHTPETLGIDRLINTAAAYHTYKTAAIVVDMGSATTIDYVTDKGEFLGGIIAPGLLSSYKGLLHQAPALPAIELKAPEDVVGRTTDSCMRSGVLIGHASMVNEMVRIMSLERKKSPKVIVTGGFSSFVGKWLNSEFIVDKDFTIKGIYTIYNRMKK
jgi:type III pantothenate kinase